MTTSLKLINTCFLVASAVLVVFCGFEFFLAGKIHPYAFIGILGTLSFSSYLTISFLNTHFGHRFTRYALSTALTNSLLLISFFFFPKLLTHLWNISLSLVFLFPVMFILHLVYLRSTLIEKLIYYNMLLVYTLFELCILLQLSSKWIYDLLFISFTLEVLLLITLMIVRLKEGKEKESI
jgi:hypothetical protein